MANNSLRLIATTGGFLQDYFDLWIFPATLIGAWFYYPHCQSGPTLCIWRLLLKTPCPTCGLTRGVCFLVHGKLLEAIHFNPLSLVVLVLMAYNFLVNSRDLFTVFFNKPRGVISQTQAIRLLNASISAPL